MAISIPKSPFDRNWFLLNSSVLHLRNVSMLLISIIIICVKDFVVVFSFIYVRYFYRVTSLLSHTRIRIHSSILKEKEKLTMCDFRLKCMCVLEM